MVFEDAAGTDVAAPDCVAFDGAGFDFLGVRNEMRDPDIVGVDFGGLSETGTAGTGDWKTRVPLVSSRSRANVSASVRFSENRRPCRRSRRYLSKFSTLWRYRSSCATRF